MRNDEDAKKEALDLFLEAWDKGVVAKIHGEVLAETCIFLAASDLIDVRGEEAVAEIFEAFPQRIRAGDFTVGKKKA